MSGFQSHLNCHAAMQNYQDISNIARKPNPKVRGISIKFFKLHIIETVANIFETNDRQETYMQWKEMNQTVIL